jgi:hypothetical protein
MICRKVFQFFRGTAVPYDPSFLFLFLRTREKKGPEGLFFFVFFAFFASLKPTNKC